MVSHSNRKTKRKYCPNVRKISFYSEGLKRVFRLNAAISTQRSVDVNGGLDEFLLSTDNSKLSTEALKIKSDLKRVRCGSSTQAQG